MPKLPSIPKAPPISKAAAIPKAPPILPPHPDERPAPDPLAGVVYTDNLERDAAAELSALEAGFRQRMQEERERFKVATSSEYFSVVVFLDERQRNAFLATYGLEPSRYIDGRLLAHALGVDLPPPVLSSLPERSPDQTLADLALPLPSSSGD